MSRPRVAVIMGSTSDLPVMSEAAEVLEELGAEVEVDIVSAHRTPDRMYRYAREAAGKGVRVIVAGAGGAAHLPGMVASLTLLPVIGVPVRTAALSGVDSLLSIVQMPRGIPVATVAVNNARNAGLLAARIVALESPAVAEALSAYTQRQTGTVLESAERLRAEGFRAFMNRDSGRGS